MVTEKNTKAEILAYLNEVVDKKGDTLASKKESERITAVKSNAKKIVESNILNAEIIEQYNSLLETIDIMSRTVKDLLSSEQEIYSFEEIKLAKEKMIEIIDSEIKSKKEENENLKKELNFESEELKRKLQSEFTQMKSELDLKRKREEEEYSYELSRKRKIEMAEYEDKIKLRENAIKSKELSLADKEKEIENKSEYISNLEEKVSNLNTEIDKVVKLEVDKIKTSLMQQHASEVQLITKSAKLDLDAKSNEVESLKEQLKQKDLKLSEIETKLEKAYNSINDLAVKTATKENSVIIKDTRGN